MNKRFRKLTAILAAALLTVSLIPTAAFAAVTSLPDDSSERVLNIYKYSPSSNSGENGNGTADSSAAEGRTALQNIQFEIYRVPGEQAVSATPTEAEITAIKNSGSPITITTNDIGLASHSFGTGTANDGVYLVIEKANSAVSQPVAPFYVSIPLTAPTNDAWLYTVTVYPKNDVPTGPSVDKDVNAIGNDSATHDIGALQTWIIRGEVPADLYNAETGVYAKNYSFTDTLSSALTYKDSLSMALLNKAGAEIAMAAEHYTTTGTSAVDTAGGTVKVSLTQAGMRYIMENLGSGSAVPEIRVYFKTVINDTALIATAIPNDVSLEYTSSVNKAYTPATVPEGRIPEVHTGGLTILKVKAGSEATVLPGAKFRIVREATAEEKSANLHETVKIAGETKHVVFVKFYDTESIEGTMVSEVMTDANGKAVMNGLAYGTYYLIETQAPAGYNILSAPVKVTISEETIKSGGREVIANSTSFVLPQTGGTGTMIFTMGGALLIGLACMTLLLGKRKKSAGAHEAK